VLSVTTTDPAGGSMTVHVSADRARDLLTGEPFETTADGVTIHVPSMGARLIHLEGIDA
jgi:hypothetical protein